MQITRLFTLLAFSCFIFLESDAQETEFSGDGKITKLFFSNYTIKHPTSQSLKALGDAKKEEFRKILRKQVDDAVKNLADQSTRLEEFYNWLWGPTTTSNLVTDLQNLSLSLKNNSVGVSFYELTRITTPLNNNLVAGSPDDSYVFTAANKLIFKNHFNNFLIEYYNSVYNMTDVRIKKFTLSQWLAHSDYLGEQKNKADSLINVVVENNGEMGIELFQTIRKFDRDLNGNPIFGRTVALMQTNWFKQWTWIRGGVPLLNPLDFNSDKFLEKYPEFDAGKAGVYENYIDSVIKRYMLYDTSGKLDQFKKILNEKGTGKTQFKVKQRLDAAEANTKKMEKLLTTEKTLNEIEIPELEEDDFWVKEKVKAEISVSKLGFFPTTLTKKSKRETETKTRRRRSFFYNYSYSEKDKFEAQHNIKKFTSFGIRTGEIKKIVVHNIPAGADVQLKVKTTPIKDRSAFQETTDTIFGLAGEVAGWVAKLSPLSIATGLIKGSTAAIPARIVDPAFSLRIPQVQDQIVLRLKDMVIYDEEVFTIAISNVFLNSRSLPTNVLGTDYDAPLTQENFIQLFIKAYKELLKEEEEKYFNNLSKDSLHLAFIYTAFAGSSLPPEKLEIKKDENALFHSKVLTTDASDEPVKNEMQVTGREEKDSVIIAKFSYKVGKNYRFQLGAGIAYTFRDFIQSKAKEENGQIVIENTAQNYRLIVGIHIYFGKGLFLQDNRLFGRFNERFSFYTGVGIPKPLENVYSGFAYDLLPGFKLTGGIHFYRNDKYVIQNNSIIEQRLRYYYAGPFGAIQIDPASLLKALNVFKKD